MPDAPRREDPDEMPEWAYDFEAEQADIEEDDPGAECGRWDNGRLMPSCRKAGSEECDWECPYGR